MAVFEYRTTDSSAAAAGTVVADTPRQARDKLRERGLTIVEVKPAHRRDATHAAPWRRRKDEVEVVAFVRRLSTLLRVGIPLLQALETLSEQHSGRFRAIVQELADRVAGGTSLADAMRDEPAWFDELCVSIVEVGESTGSLDTSLARLSSFKEKSYGLRSRVVTALLYPAVVSVIGLCVCLFLMTYVVPNLLSNLVRSGKELPAVTLAVKSVSDLLVNWWWAILAGMVAFGVVAKAVLRTERGRWAWHWLLLHTPVLGDLIRKENTSRIAVVMAALLRSGIQFTDAIRITARTVRNRLFQEAMARYEHAVTAGSDVSEPLRDSGVFSPMVVQMLAVGQQSGELEEMLEQMSETYDDEVRVATQRFTSVLEPLLIVVLAVVVGLIALATILPIMQASNVL